MLHIFVDPADMQGDMLTVRGSEVNHMKNVCRLAPGDEVSVSNGRDQKEYRYGIETYGQDPDGTHTALLRLRFVKDADIELPVKVYLFQGLPKGDKMDLLVQKCVELGVYEVIPVAMHRSVMKLDPGKAPKKIARWEKIAEAAAMQSRRQIIPRVTMPMTMQEALTYAEQNCDVRIVPYELQKDDGSTKELLEGLTPGQSVAVFIGPEGGFEPEEIAAAKATGVKPVSLGRRILRTETAGMVVLSWLIYILEIT